MTIAIINLTNTVVIHVIPLFYRLFSCSSLCQPEAPQLPSPYVKTYLLPDPDKLTKQKTKVAKSTSHPTYNELVSLRDSTMGTQFSNSCAPWMIMNDADLQISFFL